MTQAIQWCDQGADHRGPFCTVTLVGMRAGKRGRGQKRRVNRKVLGRYCLRCVRAMEFRVKGVDLLSASPLPAEE